MAYIKEVRVETLTHPEVTASIPIKVFIEYGGPGRREDRDRLSPEMARTTKLSWYCISTMCEVWHVILKLHRSAMPSDMSRGPSFGVSICTLPHPFFLYYGVRPLVSMATHLPSLPEVKRLSPLVIRILGGNPGKFTLQGIPFPSLMQVGWINRFKVQTHILLGKVRGDF